jgi:hypothetical protein
VEVLESSTDLNEFALRLPGEIFIERIQLPVDVLGLINSIKRNDTPQVEFETNTVRIEDGDKIFPTLEQWAREVVWYESRRGNYLRTVKSSNHAAVEEPSFKAQ